MFFQTSTYIFINEQKHRAYVFIFLEFKIIKYTTVSNAL